MRVELLEGSSGAVQLLISRAKQEQLEVDFKIQWNPVHQDLDSRDVLTLSTRSTIRRTRNRSHFSSIFKKYLMLT